MTGLQTTKSGRFDTGPRFGVYIVPMNSRRPKLGSIYPRGNVLWIKYYRKGQPIRESSRSGDYEDALRLLKRRQGEIAVGKFAGLKPERIRVSELLEELIEDYRDREIRSLDKCECRIRKNLLPALGDARAADLGTQHIKRYKRQRRREGVANATINRELELLQRAFRLGYEAEPQLVVKVPRIEMYDESDNVRTGMLEHDGYLGLRDTFPAPYRLLLVVGYHLGSRLGALLQIQWPQLSFSRNEIRLEATTTKDKRARLLPIYGEMRHWLDMAHAERNPKCPYVFQSKGRRLIFNWRTWNNLCELGGVPGLHFHDLRRTALTNMVRAGIPEKVAMEISGHRTRRTFERYHIVSDRNIREVASRMEEYYTGTITGTVRAQADGKLLN